MSTTRLCGGLVGCLLLILSTPTVSNASVVYEFFDYGPAIQNLFQLSGTITVSNSAANDGVLNLAEVEDFSITIDDTNSAAGWTHTLSELGANAFSNVLIDNQKIYLDRQLTFGGQGGSQLNLQFDASTDAIVWASEYTPFVPSGPRFRYFAYDNGVGWSYTENQTQRDFILIAEVQSFGSVVPEPASLAIWTLCGLGMAGFWIRRRSKLMD